MSVRNIIVLLALPLFLLLAAVNSLLLYREETKDMEAGMRSQALAAAVTVGEFAKASPDPFADLARPGRLAALHAATAQIPGLDALYLTRPGQPPFSLLDRPIPTPRRGPAPLRAAMIGTWQDSLGRPLISALAPAGHGATVVADIDARPLARRIYHLKRLSIALIAGSTALAILLGLTVARRVTRELRRARAIIDAHGDDGDDRLLKIREVRDLADAIQLIDKSVASELERVGGRSTGDPAVGIRALRQRYFPDVSTRRGGLEISIRTLPDASAGCFHLCKAHDGGYVIAIGEIGGEPVRALASAIALRDFVATGPAEDFRKRLERAADAFGVSKWITQTWRKEDHPEPIALRDGSAAVTTYARRNPDLDPDTLTADLAILFPDAAIVAAGKPSTA